MIYITADLHLNHPKMARVRGFSTMEEHNSFIVGLWNSTIKKNTDEIYLVGDFCFGPHEVVRSFRHRLRGKIHLVVGNHDITNRVCNITGLFSSILHIKILKYNRKQIVLCHYPMRTWPKSHYNTGHLHGHAHGKLPGTWGKSFDIGLDATGFTILNIDQILEIFECLPDNINYLGKLEGK
jgi:calcineurin-like phosphoesterase family protein